MTTSQDNSNISGSDVLAAIKAKTYWNNRIASDLAAKAKAQNWIDTNTPLYFNSSNEQKMITNWNDPTKTDYYPQYITLTYSELTALQSLVGGANAPTAAWFMKYDPDYGAWRSPTSDYNSNYYYAFITSQNPPIEGRAELIALNGSEIEYWKKLQIVKNKTADIAISQQRLDAAENIIDYGPDINLLNTDGTLSLKAFINLVYNVGSVNEAYLSSNKNFIQEATTDFTSLKNVNSPSAITNAMQLWTNGKPNKGMIQPYTKLSAQQSNTVTEVNLPTNDPASQFSTKKFDPTGFQFLYNPASVNMAYSGMLGVDPNLETNGLDQFNPLGVYTQATISFNILINRMFDFKYYDRTTGVIADKYKNQNLYYPRQPEINEQKDIFKKGTMYDVEHLLRAVLGFGMPSYLGRNMSDGKTADLGFITGIPVELHLGSNLRYLGNVTQLNISHVLFDERMVPIFTNLEISFARLVDPVDSSLVSNGTANQLTTTGKYKYINHNGR